MAQEAADVLGQFNWQRQPEAAAWMHELLAGFLLHCPPAAGLFERLQRETGTRLFDFVDHWALPRTDASEEKLAELGFNRCQHADWTVWRHEQGLFPEVHTHERSDRRLAIKVESVADFLAAQGHDGRTRIDGAPLAAVRKARIWTDGEYELWVFERHGSRAYEPPDVSAQETAAIVRHAERFRLRRRTFEDATAGFAHAAELIAEAASELGVDRTCDLFFAAEREYWQRRNRAAQAQMARQDALGLGWANHDHHTYRSSRAQFQRLIGVLEQLGFHCRERFYGGREAGWGAQVLEQPNCGIVIFADVDLTPEEVTGDFAHEPLPPQERLGTVGLWCELHGEAFLQAGMHHLECQFDFDAAREQLRALGVETMQPFTDFPHLKQAFTVGETWPVEPARIERAQAAGRITREQAEQFRQQGALGSHLEILQRDDGYKGFNQTGISEIISATDPRGQGC